MCIQVLYIMLISHSLFLLFLLSQNGIRHSEQGGERPAGRHALCGPNQAAECLGVPAAPLDHRQVPH